MEIVIINTPYIELNRLLKYTGTIATGGQIWELIEGQCIFLNNQLVTEKRKKVFPGDIVKIAGIATYRIERDKPHGD